MIVVCDCSPLIALSLCDSLDLLDKLFNKVVVPEKVYQEAAINGKPEACKISVWAQGKIEKAANPGASRITHLNLGKGETEAIALYWEKAADYLLIDEQKGRHIALTNGIKIIGSLGILLLAKKNGLIPALKPLLNTLSSSTIHVSDTLCQNILRLAKE
jgi:predicted nucleic acid-binding protein